MYLLRPSQLAPSQRLDSSTCKPLSQYFVQLALTLRSYVSPFPTPAPASRPSKAHPIPEVPLFLPQESEPESDWAPTTKKGKAARRVIRDPDSDSDADEPPKRPIISSPVISAPQSPSSPISIASSPHSVKAPRSRAGPSRPKIAVNKFFDLEARGGRARYDSESEEDEEEREKKEKKWIQKYYDESLGSLKDFIVDDDYVSEEEDSEEESEDESEEEVRPRRGNKVEKPAAKGRTVKEERRSPIRPAPKAQTAKSTDIIEISDSDSDSSVVHSDPDNDDLSEHESHSDVEALLHFSPPPPRLHLLPDLATLTLLTADSDSTLR